MATTSQNLDVSISTPTDTSKTEESLEMSTLQSPAPSPGPTAEVSQSTPLTLSNLDTTGGAEQTHQPPSSPSRPTPTTRLTRAQSEALGPATESPITPPTTIERGPTLSITLMLTTGARHPYKIDEKYLRNRKVEIPETEAFDPRDISGYKLKELIWTDWRSEWEPRPATPSSIRLILLGRFVEDKSALREFPFKLDSTNVVHMTVKPADFGDDDEAAAGKGGKGNSIRGRDDGERGAGCRCVIL